MRTEIAPALLARIFRYDPETGVLYWRARSEDLFSDTPRRSRQRNAVWWNGRFAEKRACKSDSHKGYLRVGVFGVEYPAHRIVWALNTGTWPSGALDHVDGNKTNNRMSNLRIATVSENNRNRAAFGKSKFRGVSWRSRQNTWVAAIKLDGKTEFLGLFKAEEEAARAYDAAATRLHGAFACLNFEVNHD